MTRISIGMLCGLAMATAAPVTLAQTFPPEMPADTNKDGKVSLNEYQVSRRNFLMKADADKNGVVTKAEWDKYAKSVRQDLELDGVPGADKVGGGGWFAAIDTDKNGSISGGDIDLMTQHRFASMDTNHDGFLDRSEAQKAIRSAEAKR